MKIHILSLCFKLSNQLSMRLSLIVIVFFSTHPILLSQDFYIDQKTEAVNLNYRIPPKWVDLNINEAYEFLSNSGFVDIETFSNYNKEIVGGVIQNKNYTYMRKLVFEDKVIMEYSDAVVFIQPCLLCLANEMKLKMRNNPAMQSVIENSYQDALIKNNQLKSLFYDNHIRSLKRDNIDSQLISDLSGLSDFSFNFSNSTRTDDYIVFRNCSLKLDDKDIYDFFSERRVVLNEQNYSVGNYDLKEVNQYDLNLMIDIFLLDCKEHNITITKEKVIASFETLDANTLGLSYGMNDDSIIDLKIDPEKWKDASNPKRWYLIYHELGHDVLNLEHGNGGKMMFNFADRGYSWNEFWEDKNYMLDTMKN
jgi:hypothetical protein